MRKVMTILIILILAFIVALPDLAAMGAREALSSDHRGDRWAPGAVYWAGRINMRFWRYKTAQELLEKGVYAFPNSFWHVEGHFLVAKSYERQGNSQEALRWYNSYLRQYPNHIWAHQAAKTVSNLEAQYQ